MRAPAGETDTALPSLIFVLRWLRRLAVLVAIVLATLVIGRAVQSRSMPDLRLWHTVILQSEVQARDLGPQTTLAEYLQREDAVFRELRQRVFDVVPAEERVTTSRYTKGGPLDPATFKHDWNRTFELEPAAESGGLRGGVLLIHGLTDSPYSMRPLAQTFASAGFYALALRMPGHGTVPSGLLQAQWEDWMAAVRLGVRAVRAKIGPGTPLYLVGYSNGAALVTKYSLDALEDNSLPRADRVVLLSPMIGVSPLAAAARLMSRLGGIPYFEKSRWLDDLPEYIPFKYNSFPTNAAFQTYRLTSALQREARDAVASGRIRNLPPVLAFQSLVDATVSTPATVHGLFDHLESNGSEIVLFDLNRAMGIEPFLDVKPEEAIAELFSATTHRFRVTLITNEGSGTRAVREESMPAGATQTSEKMLDLVWPEQVFSLSHLALPFPMTDPLYGLTPDRSENYGVRIGLMVPRGERSVLLIGSDAITRLYCNPFFPYIEQRVREWIAAGPPIR